MRKYLLFAIFFFSLAAYFSIQNVSSTEAQLVEIQKVGKAQEGDHCDVGVGASGGVDGAYFCAAHLTCDTNHADSQRFHSDYIALKPGICVPKAASEVQCKCQNFNQSGAGKNGFVCGPDLNNLDQNKVVFCHDSNLACRESAGSLTFAETTENGAGLYPNLSFRGVRCEPPKRTATCKCIGTGTNQQNNFECTVDGEPNVKGTAFCGDGKFKCYDQPGYEYTGPISQEQGEAFSDDTAIRGIDCRQPEAVCRCKNPGRPGIRINSFECNQAVGDVVLKDTDYCTNANMACVDAPGNTLSKQKIQKNILNDAPIRDIDCIATTPVPPPAPPCAAQLDGEGRCTSFNSAFGPIQTNAGAFITSIFSVLLAVSGGIALLLIIRAGYTMMTSAGKPDQINNGREQLIAAIVGLLFIIFSFVILEVIGVDILRIPGLG